MPTGTRTTAQRRTCLLLPGLLILGACVTIPDNHQLQTAPSLPLEPAPVVAPAPVALDAIDALIRRASDDHDHGRRAEALSALDDAASTLREGGHAWRAALLDVPRAHILLDDERLADAAETARRSIPFLADTGDLREVVDLHTIAGLAEAQRADLPRARAHFEQAELLHRALNDPSPPPRSGLLRARLAMALDREAEAADAFLALSRVEDQAPPSVAADIHRFRARFLHQRGELASALSEHALSLAFDVRNRDLVRAMRQLLQLADLFFDLGRTDLALLLGQYSRELADRLGLHDAAAHADVTLGRIAEELRDLREAREHYRRATTHAEAPTPPAPIDLAWARAGLWRLCEGPGCSPAPPPSDAAPDAPEGLLAEALVARRLVERGQRDEAAARLRDLQRRARAPIPLARSWRIHHILGLTWRELGDLREARRHLRLAALAFEALRRRIDVHGLRLSLLDAHHRLFTDAADAWLARTDALPATDVRHAFSAAEQGKARALLDLIAPGASPAPVAAEVRHQRVARQLIEELLLQPQLPPDLARSTLWDDLERLAHVGELWSGLREAPAQALTSPATVPFDTLPDRVAERLDHDEVLLDYVLGPGRSYLFVVRRDGVHLVLLRGEEVIGPALERFRATLLQTAMPAGAALREHVEAGRALNALLVDPALPLLREARHLIVAPDGPLVDLPFAALIGPDGVDPDDHRPDYLVRRFSFTHAPSAAGWLALGERARQRAALPPPPADLLAVGDPTAALKNPGINVQIDVQFHDGGVTFVSHSEALEPLPRLPSASAELRRVAAVAGPSSLVLAGDEATEPRLRSAAAQDFRLLHFATHGLTDVRPLLPASVLARLDDDARARLVHHEPALVLTPGGGADGVLRLDEILDLPLRAELVVLAGCSTGRGWRDMGAAAYGLGGAFLVAGSRRALVSVWSVADRSTSLLMTRFHEGLRRGLEPDVALQRAQLTMLLGGAPTDAHATPPRGFGAITDAPPSRPAPLTPASPPFYWASFVLLGD